MGKDRKEVLYSMVKEYKGVYVQMVKDGKGYMFNGGG